MCTKARSEGSGAGQERRHAAGLVSVSFVVNTEADWRPWTRQSCSITLRRPVVLAELQGIGVQL